MTLAAVARALNVRADQPGVFSGYASLFGVADNQGDRVEPGAFRTSLEAWRAKGRRPAMLWQHNPSEPIGLWTGIEEDAVGLRVEGRLLLSVRAGTEAYEHIKAGTVSGSTSVVLLFTAGANGSLVNGIAAIPRNTLAGAAHIAIYYSTDSGTTCNLCAIGLLAAWTFAATSAPAPLNLANLNGATISVANPLYVPAGMKLYASTSQTLSDGILVTANGVDL